VAAAINAAGAAVASAVSAVGAAFGAVLTFVASVLIPDNIEG